ncbi:hypothetical protein Gohar_019519 [Gossypium harknessii]|uniref:Reverse transcriptase zinc-binding domain-containing protein n=1 Tax=Gossypium harknessii TaxID=34285 RepID=A0A7J9I7V1_9ROSI|nr:hypothetical protein [Gossypium harknessii]
MWRIPLKFQGYQRVRFFIWLALNQCLLTKVKLVRRGLDHDSACGVYGHGSEDVLYATKDCPTARNIWNHLIPSKWHTRFYAGIYCLEVIMIIQERSSEGFNSALVRRIHQMLLRFSQWSIRHISREENQGVDHLVILVQHRTKDLCLFEISSLKGLD